MAENNNSHKGNMKPKNEIRGTARDLAQLLMVSQRWVNKMADEGVISRQPEGDFLLPEAIAEYYGFKFKSNESVDYMDEKAKHEAVKRKLSELEFAKKRAEVLESSKVELIMTDMLTTLRTQLLSIPAKVAMSIAEKPAGFIEQTLLEEITARLSELSNYSPSLFNDEVMDDAKDN